MRDLILKPLKHRIHWHLTDSQKLCLDLSILTPIPKERLYSGFVDQKCTIVHAKSASKTLFADPQAEEYLIERRRWIEENWFGAEAEENKEIKKRPRLTDQERSELAQGILDEILVSGTAIDATTLRLAIEKGITKDSEQREEKPRLYVPLKCSACGYREFCESKGASICPDCKFRQFALDHGSENWDYTEILNK